MDNAQPNTTIINQLLSQTYKNNTEFNIYIQDTNTDISNIKDFAHLR